MDLKEYKKRVSNAMWIMRTIAILSVISAHCNILNDGLISVGKYEKLILNNFGSIGVGLFFFSSGYYFVHSYSRPLTERVKHRLKSVIAPWVIVATLVWLYIVLRKGGISILSWFEYVIGYKSIFYFMTDLIIFYVLYGLIWNIIQQPLIIYVSSLLLNALAIVLENNNYSVFPTAYLNPFIFCSYFALGILISRYNMSISSFISKILRNKMLRISFTITLLLLVLQPIALQYWFSLNEIIVETSFILFLFIILICSDTEIDLVMQKKPNGRKQMLNVMEKIGRQSFAIYLWHLPIAGIISNLFNRSVILKNISLLWPYVILTICNTWLWILKRLLLKANFKKLGIYLGLRI